MKKFLFIASTIAGLLLLNCSCNGKKTEAKTLATVRIYTVKSGKYAASQEFPGRVKASEEVNMAFKVSGTLQQVYAMEGSRVVKGQLLAEIDPRDYRLQHDAAKAEFLKAKAEAERIIALYADSATTADNYDKARYGLQQITAKYENAQNQLADTKIHAPFDGFVQKRFFDPPTVVAAGMPILSVVSSDNPEIEINIPTSAYLRRAQIASATASFDFLPEERIPLDIISISPKANANQLSAVRLAIPAGVKPLPAPGMSAMVDVSFSDNGAPRYSIPATALMEHDGKSSVWIYKKDNRVTRQSVVVESLHTDGKAVIQSGLNNGDRIVASGVHQLSEGQEVKPLPETSKTNVGGLL